MTQNLSVSAGSAVFRYFSSLSTYQFINFLCSEEWVICYQVVIKQAVCSLITRDDGVLSASCLTFRGHQVIGLTICIQCTYSNSCLYFSEFLQTSKVIEKSLVNLHFKSHLNGKLKEKYLHNLYPNYSMQSSEYLLLYVKLKIIANLKLGTSAHAFSRTFQVTNTFSFCKHMPLQVPTKDNIGSYTVSIRVCGAPCYQLV